MDIRAATENGAIVTYTPGADTDAVAEHTLALIMSIIRDMPNAHTRVREGKWGVGEWE